MPLRSFASFSPENRRLISLLTGCHLLWCGVLYVLWWIGQSIQTATPLWSALAVSLQLFCAAQLLLPALLLHPEERNRGFYLFWGLLLGGAIWLTGQLPAHPLTAVVKPGLLLLVATLVGAALARYVKKLWELVPICIAMTLADFASWSYGPTAIFSAQIEQYYSAPEGAPPLIDIILIKLALPGSSELAPVFGISDWIMVVFFAIVAHRHRINDNLLGPPGEQVARKRHVGRYLPVSVVALLLAIVLAQTSGLFIPALPLIALVMLLWYAYYLSKRPRKS